MGAFMNPLFAAFKSYRFKKFFYIFFGLMLLSVFVFWTVNFVVSFIAIKEDAFTEEASAMELVSYYGEQHNGEVLKVSANILNIETHFHKTVVTLVDNPNGQNLIFICKDSHEIDEVKNMKTGDAITVVGQAHVIYSYSGHTYVEMERCNNIQ